MVYDWYVWLYLQVMYGFGIFIIYILLSGRRFTFPCLSSKWLLKSSWNYQYAFQDYSME